MKNKGTNKSSCMIPVYMIHPALSTCVPSFNLLGLTVPEKSVTKVVQMLKNWRERKMKKIKGTYKSSSIIPVYTTHPSIVRVCTKCQPFRPHSS